MLPPPPPSPRSETNTPTIITTIPTTATTTTTVDAVNKLGRQQQQDEHLTSTRFQLQQQQQHEAQPHFFRHHYHHRAIAPLIDGGVIMGGSGSFDSGSHSPSHFCFASSPYLPLHSSPVAAGAGATAAAFVGDGPTSFFSVPTTEPTSPEDPAAGEQQQRGGLTSFNLGRTATATDDSVINNILPACCAPPRLNVEAQHRLAMPYVPLPAVLAATLRSQQRARGQPCGDGVTSWAREDLARQLNNRGGSGGSSGVGSQRSSSSGEDINSGAVGAAAVASTPVGVRTRMTSVFVAQLPFDMPLETLQQLADEVVPGGPVRIVLAAPHLRNRRAYDGCAFLRMPEADAHRFVAALHKRVLFDVDGAWYAESEEQQTAIAAYCTWVQRKTNGERRRLLPRPTPYSPMTVELALKTSSRITRSRNVRH
jgi:hypothetical protein